ncbi:hypothetical protein HT031_002373 [Scenedesmus sp. PABB004]|nr:hypothetical protein HT031_002373 [Scenedesmus sp. PABB004]
MAAAYPVTPKRRGGAAACWRLTPWSALLAAALFVGGLALFVGGAARVGEFTWRIADAIGVSPAMVSGVKSGLLSAALAVGIFGLVLAALVVLLAVWGAGNRSALLGGCCRSSCGLPEPWTFTVFRAAGGLLSFMVWLLLLAVVLVLMGMLLWLGGAIAIDRAITSGTSEADALLGPLGLNLATASDASAVALAFANSVAGSPAAAALLGGGARYAFQPLCPPVCLNLGSFAAFMQAASCVCGGAMLAGIRGAARSGTRAAAVALGGAFAMYVACTLLLIVLTRHGVEARHERSAARAMKRAAADRAEAGYAASPEDCVAGAAGGPPAPTELRRGGDAAGAPSFPYGL